MLTEIAPGVLVRQSAFCASNAVVICAERSLLLVDPGIDGDDLDELADDVHALGGVVAGFSTHPHWDHVLWHERFGTATTRYATSVCAATAADRLPTLRDMTARYAPHAPLDLVGKVQPLAAGSTHVPWRGRDVRVVEHAAHAPGHAALFVEGSGVLLAGDMLSDVEVPLLDPRAADPWRDYQVALDLLESVVSGAVCVLVPGHGQIARGSEIRSRFAADRSYLDAIRNGGGLIDARLGAGATYGRDWLLEAHERNLRLARAATEQGSGSEPVVTP